VSDIHAQTEDAVLGGRLRLRQPRRGHRVGHDAILLAAATAARPGEHAVELGAGVGSAGLALAWRVPGLRVTLVEIDPALAGLAAENAALNGLESRVTARVLDAAGPARNFAAAGLPPGCAQCVLMNPPFNDPASLQISPDRQRARAYAGSAATLTAWVSTANRLLTDHGTVSLIWRADGLADLLLTLRDFGATAILPVHPRADAPAVRVLVRAAKGRRTPLRLCPALVLNDPQGRPTPAAEAILRGGEALPLA
jgi:tRNA1(Val) A37 N6-methylase TrmN6